MTREQYRLTVQQIFQGLGPMIIAGFSDRAGRRPAYILCFVIYIAANLGLGLQNSFPALLVLRMVQSAGSSGTVTLANGVVGDLVTSTERGKYIAWASLGTVLGPTLSPVLGGIISQNAPYQWLFWFCLILSGIFAVPFLLLFPETCRNVVGDGSIPPRRLSWNLTDFLRYRKQARQGRVVDQEKMEKVRKQYKLHLPNPWPTLVILSNPEAAVLLLTTGIAFACYYAISTGASVVFADVYGLDPLEVGLIFLSLGIGSLISAFTTGKLVDLNYRRYARKHNLPIRKNRYTDLSDFPIERARMEPALPLFVMGMAAIIGYGWIMTVKVSLAGPIILLFVLGYSLMAGFQCMNVLMIDIYPSKPAAASAASNVVRCLLAAAASAAIEPMSQATGYGWAYTVLAFIFLLACLLLLPVMKYGIQLRRRLKAIDERKAEKAMRS